MPRDHWGRGKRGETLCQTWDTKRHTVCRNKRFGDTEQCRRHLVEALAAYESRQGAALVFYMEHREVLHPTA